MAGNVSGFIGNEQVELNNAATETTLAALLASMKSIAGGSAVLKVAGLAGSAGIDPATIAAATAATQSNTASVKQGTSATDAVNAANRNNTNSVKQNTDATNEFRQAQINAAQTTVNDLTLLHNEITKLLQGTATASGALSSFGSLISARYPVVGLLFQGFSKLVGIQEENFAAYQQLSASGITFSGSLTNLRMAAANSYMKLDDFATLMKNNSSAFSQIGGSVNEGAVAFSKFSHTMLSSEVGNQLMALGYTADEANQGMITYLAAAGASNAKDLESNKSLREGAAQYLEELDRLADVTGKSRQEQDEIMKKQKLDAEVQMTAARIKDPADRAKFEANVKYMTMMYGDAGKDMALAQAQHRSVVTKEGQTLAAIAPGMQAAMEKMAKAKEGTQEYLDAQNEMSLAAQKGMDTIPLAAYSTNDSLKKLSTAQLTVAKQEEAGLTSKKALDDRDKEIAEDKAKREKSEADSMAAAMKSFKELGASLWEVFSPLLSVAVTLASWVGKLAGGLAEGLKSFNNFFSKFGEAGAVAKGLIVAVGGIIASLAVVRAKSVVSSLASGVTGGGGGVLGGLKTAATGAAGSGGAGVPGLGAAQNAAGKVGGIGSSLAGVGKGIGDAIKGVLKGLASGLSALGNPRVLLGGVTLGLLAGTIFIAAKGFQEFAKVSWEEMGKGFVTLLGLGAVAAVLSFASPLILTGALAIGALGLAMVPFGVSVALAGPQMQNLAKGLIMLSDVSALDLLKLTGPIAGLGVSLLSLGTGIKMSESGIKSVSTLGPALNTYAQGITAFGKAVNSVDLIKAEKLKSVLKGPTAAEALSNAGAQMIQAVTKIATGGKSTEEKTAAQLESLNSTMKELVKYMKDTAENTDKTHRAAKSLNGNLWAA